MKIQSPWMGRVRGSAGNMTGSKVYDKNVLRAKTFEVSNPNTQAQQTERSFFAQVADCCASVSEEQLRSLFGVKPKSMSRRNALTKQLSAAFTIEGNNKVLDFSKLPAIGNGEKVMTPIVHLVSNVVDITYIPNLNDFGQNANQNTNLIVVIFNKTKNTIQIQNTEYIISEMDEGLEQYIEFENNEELYFYATCAADGSNVYLRGFGSFIIKTRGEK